MVKYLRGATWAGLVLLLILYYLADPALINLFPRCIFHSVTGLYCPGCGSQRALHGMLHFNLAEVFHYNLLFIPAFLLIGYNYAFPVMNKQLGMNLPDVLRHKRTPWIILIVIMLFWILRNIPCYPFSDLAPA